MTSRWTLAIDFGTTFTSAAVGADGRVEIIEVDGLARLPSAVLWLDEHFTVGVAAEAQRAAHPDRLERTPKRHLGVREHMILGGAPVPVVDAVAAVLRAVYEEALRRRDGAAPDDVCLTHPARWGDARIDALKEAAARAGILEPTFLAEPIAAALRYADVNIGAGDHVAVYDLGGGTFDTAVLRRTGDGFVLVGPPGGDERLGGEDFDHRLADHLRAQIAVADPETALALSTSQERIWRVAATELLTQARQAKEALSSNASYTVYVPAPVDRELRVTRPEFEALIRADLVRTVDELGLAVERAGLQRDQLAAIYLTGGSSRIPLVTHLVHEAFAQVPNTWEDPKCVVALGAVRADALRESALTGVVAAGGSPAVGTLPPPAAPVAAGVRSGGSATRRRRVLVGAAVALGVALFAVAIAFAAGDDPSGADSATTTSIDGVRDDEDTTTDARASTTTNATTSTDASTSTAATTTLPATTAAPTTLPGGAAAGVPTAADASGAGASAAPVAAPPVAPAAPAPQAPADPVVPIVTGQTLDQAAANLRAAGFNDIPYVYDCYGSNNRNAVVSQSPAGGTPTPASTAIRLQLQADNCAFVPNVVGQDLNGATAVIQAAGFNDIPYAYDCFGSSAIGAVVSQSPTGGQVPTATPIRLQLQANNC